ncbi:MAG: hypothetical protein ABWX67_08290 [Allosphingosinicella sp.]
MLKRNANRKTAALLAALTLASTGLVLPAPANAILPCETQMAMRCNALWDSLGYPSYEDCLGHQIAINCWRPPTPPSWPIDLWSPEGAPTHD